MEGIRGQSGAIGAIWGNQGQLGTIRRQSGTNWSKLEVIIKDKKDKLGKRDKKKEEKM